MAEHVGIIALNASDSLTWGESNAHIQETSMNEHDRMDKRHEQRAAFLALQENWVTLLRESNVQQGVLGVMIFDNPGQ